MRKLDFLSGKIDFEEKVFERETKRQEKFNEIAIMIIFQVMAH